MNSYVYAFCLKREHDEVFFRFPQLPEIISAVPKQKFEAMSQEDIQAYASDAIITALQVRIASRGEIPRSDEPSLVKADGFVTLSVQQAMKLELFKLYRVNSLSIADFSRQIGKKETSARRLLDLHHQSWATEIETAIAAFGKRLVHNWDIDVAILPNTSRAASRSPTP